ncbi:DNA-processing protein DprA, partial [Pyxidicoccus fallax]|nr:DNA-processing protein DprA [Pyxidicoccus fallax]
VFALPGDVTQPAAAGCNALLRDGQARACTSPEEVWRAVGVQPGLSLPPESPEAWESLSEEAKGTYEVLDRVPRTFDEVLVGSTLSPAALTGALVELELTGLIIQHPGRLYEKV